MFSTYSELQDEIANWIRRDIDRIPIFIGLAESEFNRVLRLRTMETDNALSLVSGSRTVAIPDNYIEPISLRLVIPGEPQHVLTPRMPQQLDILTGTTASRRPEYWAINGANIEFPNAADQTYGLSFRMVTGFALSDATPTNWLLTHHPDLYLYGALLRAAPYLVNDARIPVWQMMYSQSLKQVQQNASKSRSISSLVTDMPIARRGAYNVYSDD